VISKVPGVQDDDPRMQSHHHRNSLQPCETSVEISIRASPSIAWNLLTTAEDYTKWNSTVISVTGEIKLGKTIRLVSKLDPKREFRLTVKEFDPKMRMAWGDGKGIRVYTLADQSVQEWRFCEHVLPPNAADA
jgi:Polyketide cyclase / dehydrase and lipid transport